MIDDSDAPNATNFDTAPEGLADRTAWLAAGRQSPGQGWAPAWPSTAAFAIETVTRFDLIAMKTAGSADVAPFHTVWSSNPTVAASAWTILAAAGGLLADTDTYEGGDWYTVDFTGSASTTSGAQVTLALGSAVLGGPPIVDIPTSGQTLLAIPGGTGAFGNYPVHLQATVAPGAQSGLLLGLLVYSVGAFEVDMAGPWSMTLKHYRPSTVPVPAAASYPSEIENVAFDPNTNLFLAAVESLDPVLLTWGPAVYASYGADGPVGWTRIGGAPVLSGTSSRIDCMAVSGDGSATSNAWVAVHQPPTTFKILVAAEVGGTWSTKRTLSNGVQSVEMIPGPTGTGSIIYATASQVDTEVALSSSLDGGATWHDFLPYGSLPGGAFPRWVLRSNGPLVIACPAFWTPAAPALFTTVDGLTWTSVALPFLTGTKTVAGLTWSAAAARWYLLVQLTTTTTALYSSPDGATWSIVGTGGPAGVVVADLAALSNVLVATLQESVGGGPSGLIYSTDNGATWSFSQATFPTSVNNDLPDYSSGYSRPRLVSSGIGLMAFNNLWARFSALSGPTASTTASPPTVLP